MSRDEADEPIEEGDEFIEIDWEPLQAAVDAMDEFGLDFSDNDALVHHWGALLASLLRKIRDEQDVNDEELSELAAEVAAFAVDLALSEEEIPAFEPSEIEEEN
jgi:hypothetical protein